MPFLRAVRGIVRGIVVIGFTLLCMAGCETTSPPGRLTSAATPQEKAQRDQLSKMSREDAADAGASSKMPGEGRQTVQDRRAGQRVIDQPVRP